MTDKPADGDMRAESDVDEIADILCDAGWLSTNDAQWERLKAALPKLSAALSAPTAPALVSKAGGDCDMGVGCKEAGVCYASAHGQPERCSKYAAPQPSGLVAEAKHTYRQSDEHGGCEVCGYPAHETLKHTQQGEQ